MFNAIRDFWKYSKFLLLLIFLVICIIGILSSLAYFINRDHMSYEYSCHYKDTSENPEWAYGTFEKAQKIVKEFIDTANPGELSLSYGGMLQYYSSQKKGFKFNYTEIVYKKVAMLLSEEDYEKYYRWLEEISKPYKTKQKLLGALVDPTW